MKRFSGVWMRIDIYRLMVVEYKEFRWFHRILFKNGCTT